MMKHEFEALAGYEVSFEDYNRIIEPMYMATELSKEDFVKWHRPQAVCPSDQSRAARRDAEGGQAPL